MRSDALVVSLMFLLAIHPVATQEAPPPLWGALRPGPHAVGFKVLHLVDDARPFDSDAEGPTGRPIRILLWYPGEATTDPRLTFADYLQTRSGDRRRAGFNEMLIARDRDTARRQFSPPDSGALFERLMNARTASRRNLRAASGRFPLVVHSLGLNDFQQESTVLWEYLASHGYVVATVPQLGSSLEQAGLRFSADDLEIQARDVEFAISALARTEGVDSRRIALTGHSAGAVVDLLVASRHTQVGAVASLDGSITTVDGREMLAALSLTAESLRVPLLNLYAAGKRDLDLSVVNAVRGTEVYSLAIGSGAPPLQATHFDFQNWPLYAVLTGVEDARGAAFRSAETGAELYLAVCTLTRQFLDATLKCAEDAARYLRGEVPNPEVASDLVRYPRASSR